MTEISRRALLSGGVLLAGVAAGAGLGLTKGIHHKVAVPPPPPPSALTEALGRQQRLLAGYDAVLSGHYAGWPAVGSMRSDVSAHGDALRALLEHYPGWRLARSGTPATSSRPAIPSTSVTSSKSVTSVASSAPGPSTTATSSASSASSAASGMAIDELAGIATADAKALTEAALAWPATEEHALEVVPMLGSIAACLASHAQELAP